jgi:hypothetical protein
MNVAEGAGMHEADRRVMTMGRASVAALCPAAPLAAAATPAALGLDVVGRECTPAEKGAVLACC